MADKSLGDIFDVIKESVDVIEVLKPIYNFKANYFWQLGLLFPCFMIYWQYNYRY